MPLFNVKFGKLESGNVEQAEEFSEMYLNDLRRNGQVTGPALFTWQDGIFNAYVTLAHRNAHFARHHSYKGKQMLERVEAVWGQKPQWIMLADFAARRPQTWKGTSFLYLFTHACDTYSPVMRGDDGFLVPAYLLPIDDDLREDLHWWVKSYRDLDSVWLNTASLEVKAYCELADPASRLSIEGRAFCKLIEKPTGIPTYYYLMRYWSRKSGEENRRCPGCGGKWRVTKPKPAKSEFWHFDFQCKKCRLVSHLGSHYDGKRRAAIGEFKRRDRAQKPG